MPFNLKKLSERRVELMTQLENLVKTCETETRAFNEEEQKQYSDILAEVRSIDATLDAADQGAALQKVERRAAGGQEENPTQEELETRERALAMGTPVRFTFRGSAAHLFDRETGVNLEWKAAPEPPAPPEPETPVQDPPPLGDPFAESEEVPVS